VKVSYDDRTNQYHAAVSVPQHGGNYQLRTRQIVGRPPAATGSVDSAAAFDDAARAALSFAMHEDKIDPSELNFDENDAIKVYRTQPGTKTWRREKESGNRSEHYDPHAEHRGERMIDPTAQLGPYEIREIGRTGNPMGLEEYAWQVAERLVRVHSMDPNQAQTAVNSWAQYVRTAHFAGKHASSAARDVAKYERGGSRPWSTHGRKTGGA
jgi:hypothetical protein